MFAEKDVGPIPDDEFPGTVIYAYINPLGFETGHDQRRNLGIFTYKESGQHFNLGDLAAETGKALGKFTANGTATKDNQPAWQLSYLP